MDSKRIVPCHLWTSLYSLGKVEAYSYGKMYPKGKAIPVAFKGGQFWKLIGAPQKTSWWRRLGSSIHTENLSVIWLWPILSHVSKLVNCGSQFTCFLQLLQWILVMGSLCQPLLNLADLSHLLSWVLQCQGYAKDCKPPLYTLTAGVLCCHFNTRWEQKIVGHLYFSKSIMRSEERVWSWWAFCVFSEEGNRETTQLWGIISALYGFPPGNTLTFRMPNLYNLLLA